MRQYISDILVIALSGAFLVHFTRIAILGSFYVREPNNLILGAEIVMMVSFITFAAWAIVSRLRRG